MIKFCNEILASYKRDNLTGLSPNLDRVTVG